MSALLARINKSLRVRATLALMAARGTAARILGLGVIHGGESLLMGQGVHLVVYGRLFLGRNVVLSDHCALEVGPSGELTVEEGTFVGRGTVIRADESITIGARCNIAEHCSIRDQDHMVDPELRRHETTSVTSPVRLGENVWVGAGVRILRGASLGPGAVAAANAVVRSQFPAAVVVAGVPARIVKDVGGLPGSLETAPVRPVR